MEVMVIYVWQCMVVLLYNCICARWLRSIMNEHATIYIYIYISRLHVQHRQKNTPVTLLLESAVNC